MGSRRRITLGSLFDGIGGFPYAASLCGIKPLWASEVMPQAISVTRRHFPAMEHAGDITALDGAALPPVDIITFGSPCQDLSVAGRRAGLSGERSGLFTEAIRIIDEMRRRTDGRYPTWAVWENVPGALSSGRLKGSDFAFVLEALTKATVPIPRSGRWAASGMVGGDGVAVAWRVLDAQYHGVPQRRRRIFLVAGFGEGCPAEVLFVEEGLRGHLAPGPSPRQGTAADAERSAPVTVRSGGLMAFATNQRDEARLLGDRSGALAAQPGMRQQTFIAQPGCLNSWDTQQSRVFTEGGASPTLAGADGGGGRNPAGLVLCPASGQGRTGVAGARAGTLTGRQEQNGPCGNGACEGLPFTLAATDAPAVACGGAIPIQDKATRCRGGGTSRNGDGAGNGLGVGKPGDPAPTVTTGGRHAVAAADCRGHKEANGAPGALCPKGATGCSPGRQGPLRTGCVVRRLTPTECERLQGLPDGWTALGAGGETISDTRRYQMLGNSVAVPCVSYVLSNIAAQTLSQGGV